MSDSKTQYPSPTPQAPLLGGSTSAGPPMYVVGGTAVPYRPVNQRPSALRRLLRGILFASALLVLWHLLIRRLQWFRGEEDFDFRNKDWKYEVPSSVALDRCVPASTWAVDHKNGDFFKTARTSFDISLSAENIFLLSRGWFSAGIVELVTSDTQPKDTVTFQISAEYYRGEIRDLAKACIISRHGNEHGVGIFTPTWNHRHRRPHRREDMMHFSTKVVFPRSSSVNGFETDVPNTVHFVRDFKSKVTFEKINLKGSNAGIFVDTLSATSGSLHTSNAKIRGSFNTSTYLSLVTSNGGIEAEVGLLSDSTEPHFEALTSNGKLDARLRLTSATKKGGKFDVVAKTSNSPLFVGFSEAPLESTLSLEARTTNSPAHVTLDPTYEGDFDIATSSWFKTNLNLLPGADPSGKGRLRSTMSQESKSHTFGTTAWGWDGKKDNIPKWSGSVTVHTSNGPVGLDLVGK